MTDTNGSTSLGEGGGTSVDDASLDSETAGVGLMAQADTSLIHLDQFRADPRFSGIDGRGVSVVVIDTGIDLDHSFFGPDANHDGVADRIVYAYDFSGSNDSNASDTFGHGSNVTSIVASQDGTYPGMAPGVNIIALKVFPDFSSSAAESDVTEALNWVVANSSAYNIVAVNMSLGQSDNSNSPTASQFASPFATLAASNVAVVVASGNNYYNDQTQGVASPSSDPNAWASVGAVWDRNAGSNFFWSSGAIDYTTGADRIISFSQRSTSMTTIFAPGGQITGANYDGGTVTYSGTSQAAPHITGLVADMQQLAFQVSGHFLSLNQLKQDMLSGSVAIVDSVTSGDNVVNTGGVYSRVDALGWGIQVLNDLYAGTTANDTLNGTSVGDTIHGDVGNDTLDGNAGNDTVFGDAGNDRLDGGIGNDTLTGGTGADTFFYATGDAANTVTDFSHADGDKIDLTADTNVHSFFQVSSRASQVAADTVIDFAGGDTMTLKNVDKATLVAGDFVFLPAQAIESSGTTSLTEVGNTYFLDSSLGSSGPQLSYLGAPVVVGQFGSWTVIGAEQTAGGYEVAWKVTGADQYTVWATNGSGAYLSNTIGVVSGASAALTAVETGFQQDLNNDGMIGFSSTVIEASGSTSLVQDGSNYFFYPVGGSSGPQLSYLAAPVTTGQFGSWMPIGVEQSGSGYLVVWQNGSVPDQYVVWAVGSNANYLAASAQLSSASTALQVLEPGFDQDLDGSGAITVRTVIEAAGSTALARIANTFVVSPTASALGQQLKMSGAAVTVGQFGNWTPIGAEQSANGTYQVAWKNGALDQYIGWNVDSFGNYLSAGPVLLGATWYVESAESTLQQDLNGDLTIGPVVTATIEAIGATSLTEVADSYFFNYGSGGPQLKLNGAYVAVGQLGAWTPIGAEMAGNGFWITWKNGGIDQYTVWQTDGAGNYLGNMIGIVSGTTSALQQFEPAFDQDLNGDGVIPIEAVGSTKLVQSGSNYVLDPMASLGGPMLKYGGANVVSGQFGATWIPIGAEQTPTGHRVAWFGGNDQYTVWNTDAAGNYVSNVIDVVSGASADLQSLEPSLQQDLNRDGVIPAVNTIESFGVTSLLQIGNAYLFNNIYGAQLRMNGVAVNANQMGTWTAIAAEQMGAGYQVVWRAGNADLYMVWNTDLNGNYLSSPIGAVSGGNAQLEALEKSFHQDLNGDGTIGSPTFDITVNYTGDPTYQSYFTAAAQRWQQVITGDLPDVGNIDDLQITANVRNIDGPGGILGQATPNLFRPAPSFLPYTGTMTFDASDLASMASNGTLFYVILHEMGHVLGIGTLWSTLHLTAGSGSQYIGQGALNAYHQLGAGGATFVPLETTGGSGTAGVHWSEATFGNELMTGFISGAPDPLSILTIGALQDLGYTVNYAAADPYGLPGHLVAGSESSSVQSNAAGLGADFASAGTLDLGAASAPMTGEIANGSSVPVNLALLTNAMASTFVTPAGEGTGAVVDAQSSVQPFLAKPFA